MHFQDDRMKVASKIHERCSFGSSNDSISCKSSWRPDKPVTGIGLRLVAPPDFEDFDVDELVTRIGYGNNP